MGSEAPRSGRSPDSDSDPLQHRRADEATAAAPLLEMREIVKTFPGVRALDGVDLRVRPAEVHCLLGQNGAGKSTLIKVLAGAHRPDSGEIRWRGEPAMLTSPVAALRLGVATMYQELDLVAGLSVAENIFLGHEHATAGFSRHHRAREEAAVLLERLGHPDIDPTTEVGRLPAAERQLVSMARALGHNAGLIVMDEPTAALASDEVDNLFRVITELTAESVAVVYISHRMEEIRRIADRITVLKDGRTVAEGLKQSDTATGELVTLMTGRETSTAFPRGGETAPGEVVLDVEHLSRRGEFHDVGFSLHRGEILGLAGMVGSGRSEILETVFGARRPDGGRVLVQGRPLRPGSVAAAVTAGIGLAPEERKSQALLQDMPVAHNVTLASLPHYSRLGFTRREHEITDSRTQLAELDLRPPDPHRPVRTLSGGNQQKAVVGRWLLRRSRVLLLDEPTRGVDVGARGELYRLIRELVAEGVAVVVVSSEIPEVLGLADRVLVLREGRVVHRAATGDIAESDVLDMVMGEAN